MIGALRDGSWLTRERVRIVAAIALAIWVLLIAGLVATAHGTLDVYGRPLGTDFSDVYAAGRMALDGRAAQAWSWPAHYLVQQQVHGDPHVPFYGWHYPPPFLLVASLLALLPYLAALALWQGTTLAGALAVVRAIVPGRTAILAALGAVNYVTIFDDLSPRALIAELLPDVLVKGGDYALEEIHGREEVEAAGGRVLGLPFVEGISSSAIIERMKK